MKRRLGRIAGVAAAAGALAIGMAAPAMANPPNTNAPYINNFADQVRGGGSDTTYNLMVALATAYNASAGCIVETATKKPLDGTCVDFDDVTAGIQPQYQANEGRANADRDVVWNYYPIGSSSGVSQLAQRGQAGVAKIEFARSSRGPRTSDLDGLRFIAFAREAITPVNWGSTPGSPAAGVTNLSQAQVNAIHITCAITNWSQVGGANAPIVVWTSQSGSGTRGTWDGFVGGNTESCIPAALKDGDLANGERVVFENDAQPILASDANDCGAVPAPCESHSIFHFSTGRYAQTGGGGSDQLAVNGIAPTEANIISGAYPYSRSVYNVIRQENPDSPPAPPGTVLTQKATGATRAFLGHDGFICKRNGQSGVNPFTGVRYTQEVRSVIANQGFVSFPNAETFDQTLPGAPSYLGHCRVIDTNDVD